MYLNCLKLFDVIRLFVYTNAASEVFVHHLIAQIAPNIQSNTYSYLLYQQSFHWFTVIYLALGSPFYTTLGCIYLGMLILIFVVLIFLFGCAVGVYL